MCNIYAHSSCHMSQWYIVCDCFDIKHSISNNQVFYFVYFFLYISFWHLTRLFWVAVGTNVLFERWQLLSATVLHIFIIFILNCFFVILMLFDTLRRSMECDFISDVLCKSYFPFTDLHIYHNFLWPFLINDNFVHLSWRLYDSLDLGS